MALNMANERLIELRGRLGDVERRIEEEELTVGQMNALLNDRTRLDGLVRDGEDRVERVMLAQEDQERLTRDERARFEQAQANFDADQARLALHEQERIRLIALGLDKLETGTAYCNCN
jgi:hypothetical protein